MRLLHSQIENIIEPTDCCVLLVDLQDRLMPAIARASNVKRNVSRLCDAAKELNVPILATVHNKDRLGGTSWEFREYVDATLSKRMFDATREPEWSNFLPQGKRRLIVTGTEAHVCVLQTVQGLVGEGYCVSVVADAVGSRTFTDKQVGLHRMARYGADIVTTEMVIFEWLASCDHPQFRKCLEIIKR